MIRYKRYLGKVEFDEASGLFHGDVINTRDVITFEGETVEELRTAFKESIEDYLAFCRKLGKDPDKPYSGKMAVRIPPDLHRRIAIRARLANTSLNKWVQQVLDVAARDL